MSNSDKANIIIEYAEGLTRAEWKRIAALIDRKFEEAANRVTLTREDTNRMKEIFRIEQ